jgi:hypothetical protein
MSRESNGDLAGGTVISPVLVMNKYEMIIAYTSGLFELDIDNYEHIPKILAETESYLLRAYKHECVCGSVIRMDNFTHTSTKKHHKYVLGRYKLVLDEFMIPELADIVLSFVG